MKEGRDNETDQITKEVHFFTFPDKWNEQYKEDQINKLAKHGSRAVEPAQYSPYTMMLYHRR